MTLYTKYRILPWTLIICGRFVMTGDDVEKNVNILLANLKWVKVIKNEDGKVLWSERRNRAKPYPPTSGNVVSPDIQNVSQSLSR